MIRVLLFKLKTWYARAKVEYEESLQTMSHSSVWTSDPLLQTLCKALFNAETAEEVREIKKKIKNQEIRKERVEKMARKMLETDERTSTK